MIDQVPSISTEEELTRRSSLRVIRAGVLESPDCTLHLKISTKGKEVHGGTGGRMFTVDSRTLGITAASIVGFIDGVSGGSDE